MSHIAFKLALASMKKEKKNYLLTFIVAVVSFTSLITFALALNNFVDLNLYSRKIQHSEFSGMFYDLDKKSIDHINKNQKHEIIDVKCNDHIGEYNKEFFKYSHIKLLDGRLPEKDNEYICIKGHELKDSQYQLVGYINDYDKAWSLPSFDVFMYNLSSNNHYYYVLGDIEVNMDLYNQSSFIYNDALYLTRGELFTDGKSYQGKYYKQNVESTINGSMGIIIAGIIVAFIFTGLDSKRHERIFLLRGIGMSKSTTYKLVFYETIMLACITIPISLVLGVGLSYGIVRFHCMSALVEGYVYKFYFIECLKYIVIALVICILIQLITVGILFVHSFDSLIYKKRRQKLKKYNTARKMTLFELSHRLNSNVILFVLCLSFLTHNITDLVEVYINHKSIESTQVMTVLSDYALEDDQQGFYRYNYLSKQKINDSDMPLYIEDEKTFVQIDDMQLWKDHSGWNYFMGKMPQNKNEIIAVVPICSIYDNKQQYEDYKDTKVCDYYKIEDKYSEEIQYIETSKDSYKINDTIVSNISSTNQTYTITGIMLKSGDFNQFTPSDYVFFVLKDVMNNPMYINQVDYSKTHHQQYMQYLKDGMFKNYSERIIFNKSMNLNDHLIYAVLEILILLIIVFVGAILDVERMMVDIRTMMCLGMSKKQALKVLMITPLEIVIIICAILLIKTLLWGVLFVIASLILVLIYFILVKRQLNKPFEFLPTDVKRYY